MLYLKSFKRHLNKGRGEKDWIYGIQLRELDLRFLGIVGWKGIFGGRREGWKVRKECVEKDVDSDSTKWCVAYRQILGEQISREKEDAVVETGSVLRVGIF